LGGNSNGNNGNNIGSSCRLTKKQLNEDATELRRERILELTSQGYSQRQIASMLQISHGTVGNEQTFLRQKAKENIKKYIDERLPEEYEKCLVGLNAITKEAWNTAQNTEDLELLSNATTIDNALHYIRSKHKNNNSKIKLK
jgi:predicted transcriptional regulator